MKGDFWSDRSLSGKYAGDQLALDIKLVELPVTFSYVGFGVYGERPNDVEERLQLYAVNILYMHKLFKIPYLIEGVNIFGGGEPCIIRFRK